MHLHLNVDEVLEPFGVGQMLPSHESELHGQLSMLVAREALDLWSIRVGSFEGKLSLAIGGGGGR